MTEVIERAQAPWHCDPSYLMCQHGHPMRIKHAFADLRRLSGHAFFACSNCKPATYFLVVLTTEPDPHATCYAIAEDCFREWLAEPEGTRIPTNQLLYELRDPDGRRHHPTYRHPT